MTQTLPPSIELPDPPRPVSRRAARRAWAEMPVQVWWKSAVVIALVAGYVGYIHVGEAIKQRQLAARGVIVDAKAVKVLGVTEKDNAKYGAQRDQSIPVEFETILPDGRLVTLVGYLPTGSGWIKVNQEMKLRVDPDDLTHWAEVTEILPWWRVLAVPLFLLLPVALLLLGVAAWRRRRVLRAWEQGVRGEGVVVGLRHSATAPLSRVVRFTLADGDDKRVFSTLIPNHAGAVEVGDLLNLVYPQNRPGRAVIADLYAPQSG